MSALMSLPQSQQQGRQANQNGKAFEQQIAQRLRSKGYMQVDVIPEYQNPNQPFFISQYRSPFVSIYNLPMRVDFFVWHPSRYPNGLIVECKYQEIAGSTDEKLPYTVACLKKTGIPAILLLIGKGAKRGAIDWRLNQQDQLLTVFSDFEAFFRAANRDLL